MVRIPNESCNFAALLVNVYSDEEGLSHHTSRNLQH